MQIFRWTLRSAAVLIAGVFSAQALTVKPNVTPVVTNTIANYDQLLPTTRVLDLTGFFRDPDASAAAQLITAYGTMKFTLDGATTPITVANFLNYVNSGRYFITDPTTHQIASSFFHRSVSGFVIQGGGFLGTVNPSNTAAAQVTQVAAFAAIHNEPVISNKRGTIAMAKVANNPDSATSQWFINLADNGGAPNNLDTTNGGFTVFGRVAGTGMTVADAIAAVPRYNFGAPFDSLPLRNYTTSDFNSAKAPAVSNLISIPTFTQISPLIFTASSSNSAAVAVTIDGNSLLIVAKQLGSSNITVTATDLDGAHVSQTFAVNVVTAPGRFLNIATRLNIGTDDNVLIAGFIIGGGTTKRIAVRATGPSLSGIIPDVISDPTLQLLDDTNTVIASNDNWGDSPNKQELLDLHLNPTADTESALIQTVASSASNKSYTAIVKGVGNTTGVGVVEVYDLDSQAGSTLLNLSSRGHVGGTDSDAMFGGMITGGNESRRLVIRSQGPTLGNFGVPGTLPDPTLTVYDANGMALDSNDDWQTNPNAAEIQSDHLQPGDPKEPAIVITLTPGAYTAIVRGKGGTGVATVEVYKVQ